MAFNTLGILASISTKEKVVFGPINTLLALASLLISASSLATKKILCSIEILKRAGDKSLSTYWIEDPLSPLPALSGFDVVMVSELYDLTGINRISPSEGRAHLNGGHLPYVARMDGQAVGYGWVATRKASIGELDFPFELSPDDRYLCDFATFPAWQGRGLDPRLLQTIRERESENTKRFWIIHAPENLSSRAGMHKAGFEFVGQLSFTSDGSVGLASYSDTIDLDHNGANLLGVPLIDSVLAPCWSWDGMAAKLSDRAVIDSCWLPKRMREGVCCCAVEVR